jgi:hypothetical protein
MNADGGTRHVAGQRREAKRRWTCGRVARTLARIAVCFLVVPRVVEYVLAVAMEAPIRYPHFVDPAGHFMTLSCPLALLAALLGLGASIFGSKESQRDGSKAIFIAGGAVLAFVLIAVASQPR